MAERLGAAPDDLQIKAAAVAVEARAFGLRHLECGELPDDRHQGVRLTRTHVLTHEYRGLAGEPPRTVVALSSTKNAEFEGR